MIVDSSNEATQYVLDVLTHTTGGYELPPKEMEQWQYQRNAVNRYFSSLGYTNINVNQKTFCEDAYGRERVSRGPNGENRNKLTTDATARLLMEIVTGKVANPARTAAMMELLKREYTGTSSDADDQGRGFTGIALQGREGFRLWSKAGWTSTTRHDVAYVEMPDGGKFVLATFTSNHSNDREIIPDCGAHCYRRAEGREVSSQNQDELQRKVEEVKQDADVQRALQQATPTEKLELPSLAPATNSGSPRNSFLLIVDRCFVPVH